MKQASSRDAAAALRARIAAAFGILALLGHATIASAQSDEEKDTARKLFEEGKTRRDRGDIAGALTSFKGADAVMNVPTTKLAVARAYLSLGKLTEAREAVLKVEQLPVLAKEPQPFTDARAAAAQMATDLAARIPTIAIALKGLPADPADPAHRDATVTVDDQPIPKDALKAARPLNPGNHVVVARLGDGEVREEVTLAEKDQKSVTLDVSALAARLQVAKGDGGGAAPKAASKPGISPVVWGGLGVAAAGIVVGSVGGLLSMSKKSDADAVCRDSKCPPQGYDALDSAKQWATISTVGFIAAGVGVAVAGVGYFVLGKKPPVQTAGDAGGLRITPWISVGSAGAAGTF